MITLAQANPSILNQLANESFYNSNIPSAVDYTNTGVNNNLGVAQSRQQEPAHTTNISAATAAPSAPTSLPSTSSNIDTTFQHTHPQLPAIAPAPAPTLPTATSLPQINDNIANATKSADAINQDIEALGASLGMLANHLGFDPTKYPVNDGNNFINIDDFLNTGTFFDHFSLSTMDNFVSHPMLGQLVPESPHSPAHYTVDSPSQPVSASSTPVTTTGGDQNTTATSTVTSVQDNKADDHSSSATADSTK